MCTNSCFPQGVIICLSAATHSGICVETCVYSIPFRGQRSFVPQSLQLHRVTVESHILDDIDEVFWPD